MNELQIRLARATESVNYYKEQVEIAIIALARAKDSLLIAKEKHAELFLKNEQHEADQRKSDYLHCTK